MNNQHSHVTLVSTQTKWHGGEKQAALLAEGLIRRGHRCTILCREHGEFAKRMSEDGFEVHTFPGRGRSPRAIWKIRSTLKQLQPDVVHSNDAHSLTAISIAGWKLNIPLRIVARRVDFPIRSKARYQSSDGIICVSNAVADMCHAAGLASKTIVVHDGVDPQFADSGCRDRGRENLEINDDTTLLLTVAKLTDHKGHTYLLRAMPAILESHPQAILALAGDGELREKLMAEANDLGIQSQVRFLGYRHDVADLLAAADLVVQPSHMEGLCSSLIDAMLASRPIVACRAGGIPDLLDTDSQQDSRIVSQQGTHTTSQQTVGWLVPPKSPDTLSAAIVEALDDPEMASEIGQNARSRALQHFTVEHMVDSTLQAYAAIANAKDGTQAASLISDRFAA